MKKAVKYILVVLIIVSMMSTMAMAAAPAKYSAIINGELTITRGENARLQAMVDSANLRILIYVTIAQITPWNDINWLLRQVDAIVDNVKDYAASIGVSNYIICENTPYYIDGQLVLIDPLIVIPIKIWP